jgi:hypothetical protein
MYEYGFHSSGYGMHSSHSSSYNLLALLVNTYVVR